jgi:phage-related protein (TIGR01555 family)
MAGPRAPRKPLTLAARMVKGIRKVRKDGWTNSNTGLGTSRDKRVGGDICVTELTSVQCEDLHRGDDLAATIAEKLPEEMTRAGFEVMIEGDKETGEKFDRIFRDLQAGTRLKEMLTWSRVDGGSALLPGIDYGAIDLSKPLKEDKLTIPKFLTLLRRPELFAKSYYSNPLTDAKYGLPKVYWLQPYYVTPDGSEPSLKTGAIPIHETRLLICDGVPVTKPQRARNQGWGDSVYTRVWEVLRDFNLTWGSAAVLLSDWNQGVYKIAGLNEMIASGEDGAITARLAILDRARSVLRSIVLDAGDGENKGEDFTRQTAPLSGMAEMLQAFSLRLAAAARMPVTLLMGQSPAGLNATGALDARWFSEQVTAKQTEILLPVVERLVRLIFLAKDGPTGGVEPENWSIRFRPLKVLSELEEADVYLKTAQADQIYTAAQVATPEEVAATRFGGDDYNPSGLVIDMDAREKMAIDPADRLSPEVNEPDPTLNAPAPQRKGSAP